MASSFRFSGFVTIALVFTSLVVFTSVQAQPCVGYFDLIGDTPEPRDFIGSCYDSDRGITLMAMGSLQLGPSAADLWGWDGREWMRLSDQFPGEPHQRTGTAVAYDRRRHVAVLYGGSQNAWTGIADTWEWDGRAWTQRNVSGPGPRVFHSMVYDIDRGVTVLFGGLSRWGETIYGDTWEWDGETWRQRADSGPAPRFFTAMCYDTERHSTLLFGGQLDADMQPYIVSNELWSWDGQSWTLLSDSGPSPRDSHGFSFDRHRGVAVLMGGFPGPLNDTWEWDGVAWRQIDAMGPGPIAAGALVFDEWRERIISLAGEIGPATGSLAATREVWEWDGLQWLERTGPASIETPAGTSDFSDYSINVTGWRWWGGPSVSWTRFWHFKNGEWEAPVTNLGSWQRNSRKAVAYDPKRARYVMRDFSTERATWESSGDDWNVITYQSPQLSGHNPVLTYDPSKGGIITLNPYSDSWVWDGEVWSLLQTPNRVEDENLELAFDQNRNTPVVFGLYRTWERNKTGWIRSERMPASHTSASVYDPDRREIVVAFYRYGTNFMALRSWNGERWQPITDEIPWRNIGPYNTTLGYDSASHSLLIYVQRASRNIFADDLGMYGEYARVGDCNCDQIVNSFDIDAFIAALQGDLTAYLETGGRFRCWRARDCWADANRDGVIDESDIDAFVTLLAENLSTAAPEAALGGG